MKVILEKSVVRPQPALTLSGSKSETNRLLLLQALFPEIEIANASDSDDSQVMRKALEKREGIIDVHHAGTAMRFLTAYFACAEGSSVTLTGSERMRERPIGILVDGLRQLGADITYLEKEGFPPMAIKGKKLPGNKVTLKADVSSQYISALLLIAPKLPNGLELTLEGEMTSVPYIKMTLDLLRKMGVAADFTGNRIVVGLAPRVLPSATFLVESDWSSASYFYAIAALSPVGTEIRLSSFKKDSLQGDSALSGIYENFGVVTDFLENSIVIRKTQHPTPNTQHLCFNLNDTPDLAQTIAVTCFGMGLACRLTGLHTLKIKETDRLQAMKKELEKLGALVTLTEDSLHLDAASQIHSGTSIATYNDHRMAMAFAPLALKTDLSIENAEVVSKSFPAFWDDLEQLGFKVARI